MLSSEITRWKEMESGDMDEYRNTSMYPYIGVCRNHILGNGCPVRAKLEDRLQGS